MQVIYMIVGASNIVLSALFGVICPGHLYEGLCQKWTTVDIYEVIHVPAEQTSTERSG